MGIALAEENNFVRRSPVNLIFMHQTQMIGQKIFFFSKVAGLERGF